MITKLLKAHYSHLSIPPCTCISYPKNRAFPCIVSRGLKTIVTMIGIRRKISHVMHQNNNYLYSQHSFVKPGGFNRACSPQYLKEGMHTSCEASTSLKESLLLGRDTTPAAPRSMFPMAMAWLKLPSLSIDMMATSSASVAAMVVAKADSAM